MELVGRSSSLFTRVVRIVAHEVGVELPLRVVPDMTALEEDAYGGNPALKLPTLVRGDERVFGAANICRVISSGAFVPVPGNAQEMLDHAMSAQIGLVMGTQVGKLPADNVVFVKQRAGLEGALRWLDANVAVGGATLFDVQLFCLVEHLAFRTTVTAPARLVDHARAFAERASARATPYRYD